jgi:hypothetical protein
MLIGSLNFSLNSRSALAGFSRKGLLFIFLGILVECLIDDMSSTSPKPILPAMTRTHTPRSEEGLAANVLSTPTYSLTPSLPSFFPASASPSASASKRRRSDHNELERRRRVAQRDRIEELRDVLPISSTVRVSTVNIVSRAKEFIIVLRRRVDELEQLCAHYVPQEIMAAHPPHVLIQQTRKADFWMPVSPSPALAPKLPMAAPKQSIKIQDEEEMKRKILEFFVTHRLSTAVHPAELTLVPGQVGRKRSSRSRRASPNGEPENNAKAVNQLSTDQLAHRLSGSNSSSNGGGPEPTPSFQERRNSSLLFSAGTGVFWTKRDDSTTDLMSAGTSLFPIEEEMHLDIRCGKCRRGLDNFVMIDCLRCKQWYHIRCVGIHPNNVPLTWTCPEC